MPWFARLKNVLRAPAGRSTDRRVRPQPELLESRVVPFAWSGYAWPHPEMIRLSIVPDGTLVNGYPSNMISSFSRLGTQATWQKVILKAAQVWAERTNINFSLVADNGAPWASGGNQQGDPNFGDIRIGGYNFGNTILAQAYMPPPVNNYPIAGDIAFNTAQNFNLNTTYDLFTVASHEIGHALGLYHGDYESIMSSSYPGTLTALDIDDIEGIRAVYSGNASRAKDSYDVVAANDTSVTATDITAAINTVTQTALVTDRDLTTSLDVDWYKLTVPSGTTGTLKAIVQSAGLSLLNPKVDLYSSTLSLLKTANAGAYGATISVTQTGVSTGQVYYVRVSSTDSTTALKTGKYALVLNTGAGADPTVPLPNTLTPNGYPLTTGGGQAIANGWEVRVNSTTSGDQALSADTPSAVAIDDVGNSVVVWSSYGQDASDSWDVYAQRYNAAGVAQGGEFRVNTTTAGHQMNPSVAMGPGGDFVITWSGYGQDASQTWGIFARRYDAAGVAQGGEFRVNSTVANQQKFPAVAVDGTGNFVISWSSKDQDARRSWGVYAQRYDANGETQGDEFKVNTTTTGDQIHSSVSADNSGNVTITWSSYGQDAADSWGIYAQRYDANGVAQGGEFRVNRATAGDQESSRVVAGGTGEFVVVWTSDDQDGSGLGVYAQRFDSSGVPQGDEILVNTTTAGDQATPAVAVDASGNFVVTWASYGQDTGNSWGVYAQQFSSTGMVIEGEFRVNSTSTGDQQNPSVTIDTKGHLVIVWSGNGTDDTDGLFSQRYAVNTGAEKPPAGDVYDPDGHDHDADGADGAPADASPTPARPLGGPVIPPGSRAPVPGARPDGIEEAIAALYAQEAEHGLLSASLAVDATRRRKVHRS
jgi:hypothetical protein